MNINLTLIAQLASFAVFVWFTMKFVWPPLVKAQAREALRTRVAELAVAGAEKILRKEINADAHKEIVDELAKQI